MVAKIAFLVIIGCACVMSAPAGVVDSIQDTEKKVISTLAGAISPVIDLTSKVVSANTAITGAVKDGVKLNTDIWGKVGDTPATIVKGTSTALNEGISVGTAAVKVGEQVVSAGAVAKGGVVKAFAAIPEGIVDAADKLNPLSNLGDLTSLVG